MSTKTKDPNKGRLLGVHCSISGGVSTAPERGGKLGCSAIQIFSKNGNQWKASPLKKEEIKSFQDGLKENNIRAVFSHAAYLINLATVDPDIQTKSMDSMRVELQRAEALELPYVIVHPGSHKEAGELVGIMQIVENLTLLLDEFKKSKTQIVLETTAGQGSSIGSKFEDFAEIFDRLDWPKNIGLCVDTAHIFEAGYDISDQKGYDAVMNELDEIIGLDYIRAFHLNDSKTELGSRVDRHEHIGKGKIGKKGFEILLKDKRFFDIPMVLETPKGPEMEEDKINLKLLRSFI